MTVLQKFISQSGYCSRRKAEELIRNGKVFVNNKKAELGMKASEKDEVKINNKIIGLPEKKLYIKLNKPIGYTCTNRKFFKEDNVFELLNIKERLHIVGRLDKKSCGLLLLTNDGGLTEKLTHPRYEHEKEYELEVENEDKNSRIGSAEIRRKFLQGVDIGEGDGVVKAKEIKQISDNKFRIILTEGKKRQIRRMFKALDFKVLFLKRIRIGNLKLGDLSSGRWEYLNEEEIRKII
jgi:pseudouridine synthase